MQFAQTKTVLNQLVADLSQMAAVVHQTHWYMRGPEFLFLHPLMDDYQDDLNDQLDEIAARRSPERILLISTHLVEQAERLANCALFLRRGELVREGALDELCRESSLEDLYREIYGSRREEEASC